MKKVISSFILDEHFKLYQLTAIGSIKKDTQKERQIRIIRIDRDIIQYRDLPESDEKRQLFILIEQRIMEHLHSALPCGGNSASCDLRFYIPELNFTMDTKIFFPSDNLVYVKLLNRELFLECIRQVMNSNYSAMPVARRFNIFRRLQNPSSGIADFFPAALFLADTDMRIIWANSYFYRLLDIPEKNSPGDRLYLTDFLDDSYLNNLNLRSILESSSVPAEINLLMQYKNSGQRKFWGETRMAYEKDSDMHFGIITEIGPSLKTVMSAHSLKLIDSLTGLPGKEFFSRLLASEIEKSASSYNRGLTVISILLDGLDRINTCYGKNAGDTLVKTVSLKIIGILNIKRDTLARTDDDRFMIIIPSINSESAAVEHIGRLKRIADTRHIIDGQSIYCPVFFGAAIYPGHGTGPAELINNSEKALYLRNDSGEQISHFIPAAGSGMKNRVITGDSIYGAVSRNEFVVHYQPIVKSDRTVIGLEALVRWDNPVYGLMYPKDFINAAEHSGAIFDMGLSVLRESCRLIKECMSKNLQAPRVSINLSKYQFNHPGLLSSLTAIIARENVQQDLIEFEITESSITGSEDSAARTLADMKEAGIKVSLDNFGTGYSLLSMLHRFPLSSIKIDRGFIHDSTVQSRSRVLMKHIVDLGHDLGLTVTAEGVENREQFQFLQKRKFDLFQGYLFGYPVPGDEIIRALADPGSGDRSGPRIEPQAP